MRWSASSGRADRSSGNLTIFQNGVYTACEPCKDDPRKPPKWQVKAARRERDCQLLRNHARRRRSRIGKAHETTHAKGWGRVPKRRFCADTDDATGDARKNDRRIGWMNDDTRDAPAIEYGSTNRVAGSIIVISHRIDRPDQRCRCIAVIDAVYADARVTVSRAVCFAGAYIEYGRIGRRQRQRADG